MKIALRIIIAVVVLALVGGIGWIAMLPPKPGPVEAPAILEDETAQLVATLTPRRDGRPVVAIVGINAATETTDYLMPAGILRRADVADVALLATGEGPLKLYPALTVEADATLAAFDAAHPDGADYVIVPAMQPETDPVVLDWIRIQAGKGAVIIGVCFGAKVVANAGLLDGKRATTHWFALDAMLKEHPSIIAVPDRRMVADGQVVTTTGITASIPLALTLVEAIAGRERAAEVARGIGLTAWDARHASGAFRFNRDFALTVIGNTAAVWAKEELALELRPEMDEVALALVADAWSRTYRSQAVTFADGPVTTRNGVTVLPDRARTGWQAATQIGVAPNEGPARVLDRTLQAINARYGAATRDVVAMQLEYPG